MLAAIALNTVGGAAVAVLDGVGAGADGAHHALGGRGVDGDQPAGVMGGGNAGVELRLGKGGRLGSPLPQ